MQLLIGEVDRPLNSNCVCPNEGRCLRKVITRCRFGYGLIVNFVVSCVRCFSLAGLPGSLGAPNHKCFKYSPYRCSF